MQIRGILLAAIVIGIMVLSFVAGLGSSYLVGPRSTKTVYGTSTLTETLFPTSGTNESSALVTEVILMTPEIINDICILQSTLAVSTAYQTPTNLNLSNSSGLVPATLTTTTVLLSGATTTLYKNATIISDGTTCTEINPYYNVTSTSNSGCYCV